MENEMIERVARVLAERRGGRENAGLSEFKCGNLWATSLADARAAIEAMREPTAEMARAVEREIADWDSRFDSKETIAACAIDAYIDAALEPAKQPV